MMIGTWLFTKLHGQFVGQDALGNHYYQERARRAGRLRARRWVLYAAGEDATQVPPEWHAWLHYTTDAPLPETTRRVWQKPHLANPTGTALSYRPSGHDYMGGNRAPASGDYEAWSPEA